MFTRKQYMNKECTHSEYYSQLAPIFTATIRSQKTQEEWKALLAEDKNLNNVPLEFWDCLSKGAKGIIARKNFVINGRKTWSLSDGVCAAKEAARQIAMEE